jgi:hypothetical protein
LDNHSTFPESVEYLKTIEHVTIDSFDDIGPTIKKYTQDHYIVTDDDCLLTGHLDIPFMLEKLGQLDCIGCSLDMNIPDHYPLREAVIQTHAQHFQRSTLFSYRSGFVVGYHTYIATTFALYRPDFDWNKKFREKNAIRLGGPFTCKHLDWYVDPYNMSDDLIYYRNNCNPTITHWSCFPKN